MWCIAFTCHAWSIILKEWDCINCYVQVGQTALYLASDAGYANVVWYLRIVQADVNICDEVWILHSGATHCVFLLCREWLCIILPDYTSTSGHGMLCTVSDSGRPGGCATKCSCMLHMYIYRVCCSCGYVLSINLPTLWSAYDLQVYLGTFLCRTTIAMCMHAGPLAPSTSSELHALKALLWSQLLPSSQNVYEDIV